MDVHPDTRHLCHATGPDWLTYSFWFRGDARVAEVVGPAFAGGGSTVGRNSQVKHSEPADDAEHAGRLLTAWAAAHGYTIQGGVFPVKPKGP